MKKSLVLVAVLAASSLPGAHATEPPDWILIKVTAGPDGASDVHLTAGSTGHTTGGILARGIASSDADSAFMDVGTWSDAPIGVKTNESLGSLEITPIEPSTEGRFFIAFGLGFSDLEPGATAVGLYFVTGAVFDSVEVRGATAEAGSVATEIHSGSGSTVIPLVTPADEGTALVVGPLAAGSTTHDASSIAGLVGGFDTIGCDRCTYGWRSPDARTGSGRSEVLHAPMFSIGSSEGDEAFAGPAGDWRWTWSGLQHDGGAPIIGAYAPIGEDWILFKDAAWR